MKKLWYITIFILILNHTNISIIITWKNGNSFVPEHTRAPVNLAIPVGICVHHNPDTGPAAQHKQVYFRLFVFGPFISPGVHKDHVFDVTSKFFRGKRFALKPWGQGVWSSRLVEPTAALVSKRAFCLLSAQAQKALWHPSSLCFFCGLSVINSLPDRILAGSYNGMYFQGSHFMTRKVGSVFLGGFVTMCTLGLTFVFKISISVHL